MQRTENLPEDLLELGVQALCRLIEKQDVWVQEQDFRQRRALLLTAGKIVGVAVKEVLQLAEGNHLRKPLGLSLSLWQNLQ